jgi:Yip1 domain
MNGALRAKAILVDPALEWTRIELESGDPALLISRYVSWLAFIPALFGFIGTSLIGVIVPRAGITRTPLVDGFFSAIFGYVMTCFTVLLLGVIINFVAPFFGGRRDFDSAFKLAVYSFTPVWLAGVFLLLPGLRFLQLTGFYGAYILWLGLPRLIQAKRVSDFTVLIVIIAFALLYAAATAQRAVFGTPGL